MSQIEGTLRLFSRQPLDLGFLLFFNESRKIHYWQGENPSWSDELDRLSIHYRESSSQDLVPADDFVEATLQSVDL